MYQFPYFRPRFPKKLQKRALIGYISLSLALSCSFAGSAFAGPADEVSVETQAPGPGQEINQTPPQAATNQDFYMTPLANAIVNPVDRYSYEQMEQDIQALSARYGNHMTVNVIGQSLDGRNLYDIVIGNPAAQKKILFQGAIHAREYIVTPLMMQQLEYLLANYDNGLYQSQPLASILNNLAIHFVPMANPDGVTISQFGDSAIRSEELRGGIQTAYTQDVTDGRTALSYAEYLIRWKCNARGVDLNHNFDADWASLNPTLNHPSFTDYKGSAPLSEPESQALATLTQQNAFSAIINYHAMGRVLYWDTNNNQKAVESYDMAQAAAGATGYQIMASRGMGGFKDWMQQQANPVAGITIEIGRSTCPVAFSEYQAIWEQNRQIPALFCNYVLTH